MAYFDYQPAQLCTVLVPITAVAALGVRLSVGSRISAARTIVGVFAIALAVAGATALWLTHYFGQSLPVGFIGLENADAAWFWRFE